MFRRLGLRRAADEGADPARLAAVGAAVRARLLADSRATPRGGIEADLFTVPNFVPAQICRRLMALIDAGATPSILFHDGGRPGDRIRTSSTHYFRDDPHALRVGTRIDELLGIDRAHAEPIQGQRYRPGEEYRHHCDFFRIDRDHWQRERARGGQRTWTAMVYLNAPDSGGWTDFPRLGLSIAPEPGLLVVWNNIDRKGRPNTALLHAGLPVQSGVKFVLTQWYRLAHWRSR